MTTELAQAAADPRPYAPSWVHQVGELIDRAPGPSILVYAVISIVATVGMHLALWSIEDDAFGTVDQGLVFFGLLPAILLWAIGFLEGQAGVAFDAFRPALAMSVAAQDRLRYELAVLPAIPSLAVTIASIALTVATYLLDPVGTGVVGMPPLALAFRFVVEALNVALLFLLLYQLIRQARQVRRTLARSTVVDLFKPGPIYAFSRLTSRTGMVILFVVALSILLNPVSPDMTVESFLINWAPYFVLPPVIAVIAFVVPLYGLHDQLVAEKDRLQGEADERLKHVLAAIDRDVETLDLARADGLNKMLASVVQERDVIARFSTWPWSTATLRAFVSAIFLPIFLFVIQIYLSRSL